MFVEESWLDGLKWAIHYAHKSNKAFFFYFFCLMLSLSCAWNCMRPLFNLFSGIWGTHSKFVLGLPKGPWVFVETPGWMDWKGHTNFILHTNRAKIIISGLVAESELCLKLHQGPFFLGKTVLDFLFFSAIPKGIRKTRLKCFFGLPKGPWIVHLSWSSGFFYLDGCLVFTPGVVCA